MHRSKIVITQNDSTQSHNTHAPSVDTPQGLKLSTGITKSIREPMIGPGTQLHPSSSVLFSLNAPTAIRHEAAPSYTSLNTRLYPMGTTAPPTAHFQSTLQPVHTRSVLRPAVSQNNSSFNHNHHSVHASSHTANGQTYKQNVTSLGKDTDDSGKHAPKPSPADDYNRRKSELDALVQRFEARKKSEVVGVQPERSVSHSRNAGSSVGRGVSSVGVPVPRINLQESLTEISHGRSRLERQASAVAEARRADIDRSVDDRHTGEPSKSSCRTIALHSETGKTIRGSAERIPITRERSRTIERYLRRKSSAYQLDERSVELEPKPEPANRKLSVDADTTLRCRCLNTDTRSHAPNKAVQPKGSKESDSSIKQSNVEQYPPRRLRSEAQDREYREVFNIKAYEEKENLSVYNRSLCRQVIEQKEHQPTYSRHLSRQLIESRNSEQPSQQRLNKTMSTFTNQTFAGLEGSENSTYTRYATDDRLGLGQQKTNSSQ